MKNILTIDVEEFYHRNDFRVSESDREKIGNNVEQNVSNILALLDRYNAKATFFVLGIVAESSPPLVKEIVSRGHEVASHGYQHNLIYDLTEEQFCSDLKRSKEILENILGKRIHGYRAPSWSITDESLWALNVIRKLGFRYDSSIFPVKTFLYGVKEYKNFAHLINQNQILEVPPSTIKIFSQNIPFSGGFYLRLFPYWFIKKSIRNLNKKGHSVMIYFHSWEIDSNIPVIDIPLKKRIIPYLHLKSAGKKFERLLHDFTFTSIEKGLDFNWET